MADNALCALAPDWRCLWGLLGPRAAVPEGSLICAIGDIHGRADLLARLHESLARLAAGRQDLQERVVIYLGDYIDRGPASREVLDQLCGPPLKGFRAIHLTGNHEETLLRFLEDPQVGGAWLAMGGGATLRSYGVDFAPGPQEAEDLVRLSRALRAALPPGHLAFLQKLALRHRAGGYFFVHAGIRPGRPLEDQAPEDLLWIRQPFLRAWRRHDAVIVHGHCAHQTPQVRHNRIGIDTGAYLTDRLTCLVLQGSERALLITERA
ncbi:MAG: serine/threonine protein phosphatase [Proteobacteria bacterium]|nr:serine/threonine protein phosphatase [Pseudomonadota bacterium]